MWSAIAVHALAVALDLGSTEYALSANKRAYEGNWMLRDRGVRITVKVAEVGLLTIMDRAIEKKHGKKVWWFRGAVVLVNVGVAYWNVKQARR
jgi:hypothetical protein